MTETAINFTLVAEPVELSFPADGAVMTFDVQQTLLTFGPIQGTFLGEDNTATNVNTGIGIGVVEGKVGADLQFRGLLGKGGLVATLNAGTKEIEIDGTGAQFPPGGSLTQFQFHDTGGVFAGSPELRYDKASGAVLVGASAVLADFPNAQLISSQADTGFTNTGSLFGIVGEAIAAGNPAMGVMGVAKSAGALATHGLFGAGLVGATDDTAPVSGGTFLAVDTHAGGENIGVTLLAVGSGVGNFAVQIVGGDIQTLASLDWDLVDNTDEALSFDATGHAGLLVFDTTNAAEQIRIGNTANRVDFPRARLIASQADTSGTSTFHIGIVGEAVATDSAAAGVYGFARTDAGVFVATGVVAVGKVTNTADAGISTGITALAIDTHAGGDNVGGAFAAIGGINNYAIRISAGDIQTAATLDWDLLDNNAAALSFNVAGHDGLLVFDTTNGEEQVRAGTTAVHADFPNAQLIISKGRIGIADTSIFGAAVESIATNVPAVGLLGISQSNGVNASTGVLGIGIVGAAGDTGQAQGGQFFSTGVHTGGPNVGATFFALNSSVSNYAIQIVAGDISTTATVDWDLVDNTAAALSFDTPGHDGLLVLDTTTALERVRVGMTAAVGRFTDARMFVSQADSGFNLGGPWAFVAEVGDAAAAIGAFATAGAIGSNAIFAQANVTATGDTGLAEAIRAVSVTTHAGGDNVALSLQAANGANSWALQINDGDIQTQTATAWGLVDNNAAALSFDAAGHSGLLVLDTTNAAEQIRAGNTAVSADWPKARAIFSQADSGDSWLTPIGLVGEAAANSTQEAYGLYGAGKTSSTRNGYGLTGVGRVNAATDAAGAVGGSFFSIDTHTAGANVGIEILAINNTGTNIAIFILGGDIQLLDDLDFILKNNVADAISFDGNGGLAGILAIDTTTGTEGVTMSADLQVSGALNHDGSTVGFYGATPVAQSAVYTPSNVTADRVFDANSTTLNELADIVGTMIADLQAVGLFA